jgi:hypothetical protein
MSPIVRRDRSALLALLLSGGVGGVLLAPLLGSPRVSDDLFHIAWRRGWLPTTRAAWDLFRFIDTGETALLRDGGVAPWFVDIDARGGMVRPLTSLSIALDIALFGDRPWPAHLHSLLWWAALVACALALLPKQTTTAARALVLCGFATSFVMVAPVGWIANRGVLMAGVFSLLAYRAALPQPLAFSLRALGLATLAGLCGEYSLCWTGLVVCLLLGGDGSLRERARGAATLAVPVVVIFVLGLSRGGGLSTASYLRPFDEPGRALSELLPRYLFHASQLTSPWARPLVGDAAAHPAVALLLLVGAHLGVVILAWGARHDRVTRGAVPGMLAALVPVLVAPPNPRLLLPASLGLWILLARSPSRAKNVLLGALVVMGALQCGVTVRATASQERQWFSEMRADRLALGDLRARSVLAFVDADMESWFRLPLAWRLVAPAPRRVLGVSFGAAPSRIDRVDPRRLRVVGEDLVSPALLTLRQGARPLRVGDAVTIGGVRVVVEATRGATVTMLRVETPTDLGGDWVAVLVRGHRAHVVPWGEVGR